MGKNKQIIYVGNEQVEIWETDFSEETVTIDCRVSRLSKDREFKYDFKTWDINTFKRDLLEWIKEIKSHSADKNRILSDLGNIKFTDSDIVFLGL